MEHILETEETPLECGHWIHRECLVKSVKHTCPLCREKMKDFEIKYIYGKTQSKSEKFNMDIVYRIITNIGINGLEYSGYVLSDNEYTFIEHSENDLFNNFIYSIILKHNEEILLSLNRNITLM